ncbi:MAG: transposase [Agathobacter sp.]
MIRLCKYNQDNIIAKVRNGELDAVALSTSNLIDEIILQVNHYKVFDCLKDNIPDLRSHNTTIPYHIIWDCSVAAKMRVQTSLSDIPFAINDHRTLAELGYTIIDTDGNFKSGLMQESSFRSLLGKYDPILFIDGYNNTVREGFFPLLEICPDIHILDCTDLDVNLDNPNYEGSGLRHNKMTNFPTRGYKLATLRGLVEDTGLIKEIRFGSINMHDIILSKEMVMSSPHLEPGDIPINDRVFFSRDLLNYLKLHKEVDIYIPLKSDMYVYNQAVAIAVAQGDWKPHSNKKRKNQFISLVSDMEIFWRSSNPEYDVPFNCCVVWDKETNYYFVFISTDLSVPATSIISTYELRPEIEEAYRQLKDFWKIEDFKSTKLNVILFHIACVLFGYLFFQLYTVSPEGAKYLHKSLPKILKNYIPEVHPYVVLYARHECGILTVYELMEHFSHLPAQEKEVLKEYLYNK